jgi:P4 family phage/plasmid primase-like protien
MNFFIKIYNNFINYYNNHLIFFMSMNSIKKLSSPYPFVKYLYEHQTDENNYNLVKNGHNPLIYGTGKYYIPDDDWDNFYELACNFQKQKGDGQLHILNFNQKIKEVGPLTLDFDIVIPYENKYEIEDKNKKCHIYTYEDVKVIANIINKIIFESFDVSKENIECYIMEKPQYTIKINSNEIKDGFHVFYDLPFRIPQKIYIYNELVKKLEKNKLFDKYNIKESYDKIVDSAVISKNFWMIYGAIKEIKDKKNGSIWSKPYELTKIYNYNLDIEDIDATKLEIAKFFNIRKFKDEESIKTKNNINIEPDIEFYKISSTKKEKEEEKQTKINNIKINIKNRTDNNNENNENNDFHDYSNLDMEQYQQLFEILKSSEDSYDYDQWSKIMIICKRYNDPPKYDLKQLFIDFSSKDPKKERFDPIEIEKRWTVITSNTMKKIKFGTLVYYCRNIDEKKTNTILNCQNTMEKIIEQIVNYKYDSDIARYLFKLHHEQLICHDPKKGQWFFFPNDTKNNILIWKKDPEIQIRKYIDEFSDMIKNKRNEILNDMINDKSDFNKKEYFKKLKLYGDLLNKINSSNQQRGIIEYSRNYFYNEEILNELNEKTKCIVFNNGLYDFNNFDPEASIEKNTKNCFRDIIPDDYVTYSTKYSYVDFSDDNEICEFNEQYKFYSRQLKDMIDRYMKQLFPNEKDRLYVWKLCASFLDGENKRESFYIWTGKGANGKSLFNNLLKKVFGDYYSTAASSLITEKRANANNATPALADKKGKRILVMNEPEKSDKIQAGVMKELTGNDEINARKLYKETFRFKPQFKCILICNEIPEATGEDNGTWRRIKVIKFNSCFKDNVTKEDRKKNQNIYAIDDKIQYYINSGLWSQCFMWMLINIYYPLYLTEGLEDTTQMKENLKEYKHSNDYIGDFIDSMFIQHEKYDFDKYPKITLKIFISHLKYYLKDRTIKTHNLWLTIKEYLKYNTSCEIKKEKDKRKNITEYIYGLEYRDKEQEKADMLASESKDIVNVENNEEFYDN